MNKSCVIGNLLISIFKGHDLIVDIKAKSYMQKDYYPLSDVIKILSTFSPDKLTNIGKNIPDFSLFPPTENFSEALEQLDIAYKMNHYIGENDIGSYNVQKLSNNLFLVDCQTPYPCKFNYGLLLGLAARFGTDIEINEIDSDNGGVFEVTVMINSEHNLYETESTI